MSQNETEKQQKAKSLKLQQQKEWYAGRVQEWDASDRSSEVREMSTEQLLDSNNINIASYAKYHGFEVNRELSNEQHFVLNRPHDAAEIMVTSDVSGKMGYQNLKNPSENGDLKDFVQTQTSHELKSESLRRELVAWESVEKDEPVYFNSTRPSASDLSENTQFQEQASRARDTSIQLQKNRENESHNELNPTSKEADKERESQTDKAREAGAESQKRDGNSPNNRPKEGLEKADKENEASRTNRAKKSREHEMER